MFWRYGALFFKGLLVSVCVSVSSSFQRSVVAAIPMWYSVLDFLIYFSIVKFYIKSLENVTFMVYIMQECYTQTLEI